MPHLFALLILSLGLQANIFDSQSWERARSVAEAQHEIVMLLIKGKQFDKVLQASQEIFSLRASFRHRGSNPLRCLIRSSTV